MHLPILCTALSRGRGSTARNNKSNIEEMDKIRANCKDWLLANGYTKATDCYHLAEDFEVGGGGQTHQPQSRLAHEAANRPWPR